VYIVVIKCIFRDQIQNWLKFSEELTKGHCT